MNKIHLHNILTQYIEKYDELNDKGGHNEGYKWFAASWFKSHWDIDAEDFQAMFKLAFKEMSNLIDNSTVQPVGGILMLLNHAEEVEFVRNCFKELFSEDNGDIDLRQERTDNFITKINSHIDKYAKGSWKYPQQRNNVICYLNLWKPNENYMYKSTEATEWANCIEFGDDFGSGNNFSLKKYYKMCDELLSELKNNETIMKLYHERLSDIDNKAFNDDAHILVYDIIYCAKAYNLYKNVPSLKKLSTKDRLRLAETSEQRETLLERFTELTQELERLDISFELPDITNEIVHHKKWGDGTVISCNNNVVEIQFNQGTKKLQYPGSINKFITLSTDKYGTVFDDYMQNLQDKNTVESELSIVKRELELLNK